MGRRAHRRLPACALRQARRFMRDFYLIYVSAFVQAVVESIAIALILAALCWLIELVARRRFGFYAGFLAIFAVVYVIQHFAYLDFIEWHLADPHGWGVSNRMFYVSLALITIPLLIL